MKVLVVEDTPTQAAMIKLGLVRLDHEVVLAGDGIDAIEKVYKEQPDLIVSDVVMPRLNGYQMCRLLKDDRQTSGIPLILLTSLDQKEDVFWGLKSGADKFITKGGDIPELVGEIQVFLDEWYRDGVEGMAAGGKPGAAVSMDFNVIERVMNLLDRNLFESTVVNEIQNLVNTLDDYQKAIISVLEILGKVIDFHVGCIALVDEGNREYHYFVNKSVDRKFLAAMRRDIDGKMLEGDARGAAKVEEEVEEETVDPNGLLAAPGDHPAAIRSVSSAVLTTKGRSSGVIYLASSEENNFSGRTAQTFEIICRQANIVIAYARLYERNKRLSITDGLTKLYNHRYFQEQLTREFSRCSRHRTSLSLIMMDIDHFKSFNDTYGHQQGDIVLRELARVFQQQVRGCDVLARYGGEEFAVVMPETDAGVAVRVAERLRAAVEKHGIPGQEEELKVTISMGVATVPRGDIATPAELVTAADQALYRAKENGRNRIEC
jgi:two-component system cell cycle response regulator